MKIIVNPNNTQISDETSYGEITNDETTAKMN